MTERFWSKVDRDGPLGCWLWRGTMSGQGYGRFLADGKLVPAHRWAYESAIGPVPQELHLDHLCRVRNCVNPEHLEPVTVKENVLRGIGPTAINARKSHCPEGHPFDDVNTHINVNGHRECRECRREQNRKRPTSSACPECNKAMRRTNVYRHLREVHGIDNQEAS